MKQTIHRYEESLINTVLFSYIFGVAILGWLAVMVFLNGGIRECTFLLTGVCAVITKLFENKLGRAAKYIYACIPPLLGAITNAVCCTPDSYSYVSITCYYYVATLLLIPYYNSKLLKLNVLVTVGANGVLMFLFPAGFLKLGHWVSWLYNFIFYVIMYVACNFINKHSIFLFKTIEHEARSAQSYENQLNIMKESEEKFRALRHDMKHHLQGIYAIAQQDENDDILEYLEHIQNSLINPKEYVKTGNPKMDAIINYIFSKAERFKITTKHNIKVSKKISLKPYELNTILGNLLENALDAANESAEKYIYLNMLEKKGTLMIQVENSHSGNLITYGKQLLSTKSGSNHGYGLSNVRKIVETHNGTMDISYDETNFKIDILIYL